LNVPIGAGRQPVFRNPRDTPAAVPVQAFNQIQERMNTSRREFVAQAVPLTTGAGLIAVSGRDLQAAAAGTEPGAEPFFKLFPVGKVEKQDKTARIRIFDAYVDALLGLAEWSHVNVFYWFDKNDVPQKRRMLQVRPRGDSKLPLTGVFACRSPVRPNLIALSVCRILSVKDSLVTVDEIDAFDGTPVLDLKPFSPMDAPKEGVKVPGWAGAGKSH